MIFTPPLTRTNQKYRDEALAKLEGAIAPSLADKIPKKWEDFARLCDVKSAGEVVKLDPYWYQKKIIKLIEAHTVTMILKTRQLGLTEIISNYFAHKACLNPGYLSAIFSKRQEDTSDIAKRVRMQIGSVELSDTIERETDSLTDIQILGGGRQLFRNSTPNGGRGLPSLSDALFDEAAFVEMIKEIYGAVVPATAMLGDRARIIINSTPNTQSDWFFDKFTANNGDRDTLAICEQIRSEEISPFQHWIDEAGVCKIIVHWLAHPIYSQKKETYLQDIINKYGISESEANREYNLSFDSSDETVFPAALVKQCAIAEYQEPVEKGQYYVGIDTSIMGQDYYVVVVLREIGGVFHLVHMYRKRSQTHESYLYHGGEVLEKYKPIRVGIESNGSGQIYYEEFSKAHLNLDFQPIVTSASSKKTMINRVILAMEKGEFVFPKDQTIIGEFLSFVKKSDSKFEGMEGKKDDIILAICMAIAVCPLSF